MASRIFTHPPQLDLAHRLWLLLINGGHAIVLDAASLSRKELYVALTRGAKSLTVISSQATLNPRD